MENKKIVIKIKAGKSGSKMGLEDSLVVTADYRFEDTEGE